MNEDKLVVDAVVHAYNWDESNWASEWSAGFTGGCYGFHTMVSPHDGNMLSFEEFGIDWQGEQLEQVLFAESDIDLAVYHSVPLHDYYGDGLSALEKGVAMRERNPGRVMVYGNANPLAEKAALAEIERQVAEYAISGLKLYPAVYYNGQTLPVRLDDPDFGYPVIEKCLELGVRVIAVHKALPFGPTKSSAYHVTDIDQAAARYPEMTFEVVHAGFAWLEETCLLMARFPNVYVNLEATASLAVNSPRRFAEAIGSLLYYGGEDRVLFASGCTFVHPQPVIDAIAAFEIPADMIEGYGYPQLTDEGKRKLFGENYLRMHGLDADPVRRASGEGKWAERRANGHEEPWNVVRG